MSGPHRLLFLPLLLTLTVGLTALIGCRSKPAPTPARTLPAPAPAAVPPAVFPVMLGIDTLEATGFRAIAGKRIGLLTHPAGVNRRGESTIDVLLRAPNSRLAAFFAPEHSLSGDIKASVNFEDSIDPRTKLPIYSLHGKNRK